MRTRKVLYFAKNAGRIVFAACATVPHHDQQKSPLSSNNLARERIIATHAFLRNVTAKTPQSRPIRGASSFGVAVVEQHRAIIFRSADGPDL
jgi:hypothetical protein